MADSTGGTTRPDRRGVSVIGLLFAFAFLAVASVGFTADPWWLLDEATKWVIAGIVAVVGIGLLASALPARRRKNVN